MLSLWQAHATFLGGKILHHMKRLGLVEQYYNGKHFFLWKLTTAALKKMNDKSSGGKQ